MLKLQTSVKSQTEQTYQPFPAKQRSIRHTGATLEWIPNHRSDCPLRGNVSSARGMIMRKTELHRQSEQQFQVKHLNGIIIWSQFVNWNNYHSLPMIIRTSSSLESYASYHRGRWKVQMYTFIAERWFSQTTPISSRAFYATMIMISWNWDTHIIFQSSSCTDKWNSCCMKIASCLSEYHFLYKIIDSYDWWFLDMSFVYKQRVLPPHVHVHENVLALSVIWIITKITQTLFSYNNIHNYSKNIYIMVIVMSLIGT